LIDCYAAMMLLTALQRETWLYRLFNLAPLRWLGRVSYGAYVFHDIYHPSVFDGVTAVFGPLNPKLYLAIGGLTAFTITLVLAGLSYRFFETPFLNLKERWTIR
jgi:peptidoglycan/LPS O-acetylase OafA/YrhL